MSLVLGKKKERSIDVYIKEQYGIIGTWSSHDDPPEPQCVAGG